jgi:plasmid stabilization system protein ParE
MKTRLHPEADAELQAAAQWYEDRGQGFGERFLREAIDAFIAIEKHPHRFSRVTYRTKREVRAVLLDHFPYHVIYEVKENENQCLIVAVAHGARRPGYWRSRLY